jgi:hypothetical protein
MLLLLGEIRSWLSSQKYAPDPAPDVHADEIGEGVL